MKGWQVLGVGIDWAEQFHDVALGTPEKGVVQQFRIEHSPAGVERLITRCLALEEDPAEIVDRSLGVQHLLQDVARSG